MSNIFLVFHVHQQITLNTSEVVDIAVFIVIVTTLVMVVKLVLCSIICLSSYSDTSS